MFDMFMVLIVALSTLTELFYSIKYILSSTIDWSKH